MAWSVPRNWTNGETVTQTMLNTDVRDNMRELWHEVAYVEFTANVTPGGTEASPTDLVSSGAITYAALPTMVELGCPGLVFNTTGGVSLWDGATDLGRVIYAAAAITYVPGYAARRLTPSAASHTYKFRIWTAAGIATAQAGTGGVGTTMPGYIRIMQRGG